MTEGIDRSAYMGAFREEVEEHLQVLTSSLLSLESRPEDMASISEVFRRVHTVKGAARMMGFAQVADLAHSMEDVLDDLRSGRMRASPPLLDAMLTAVDLLRDLIKSGPEGGEERQDLQAVIQWLSDFRTAKSEEAPFPVPQPEPAVQPYAEEPRPKVTARETVRVDVERIDTILNLAGELMVVDSSRKQWVDELDQMAELLDSVRARVEGAGLKLVSEEAQRLSAAAARSSKRYRRLIGQQTELVRELHYQVSTLRMLPVRSVFSAVPRIARDLAREEHKEVDVLLEGEETEMDREVLERVRDPILHLVRNAIAHGIESPTKRLASGKPRSGLLRVAAFSRGQRAVIEVEDDGAGIDLRAVRESVARAGMLPANEAEMLDESECLEMLFRAGFTTNTVVNAASGRGVGLDVVKAEVDALKGHVWLENREDSGTKVTMELPITLAFTHVLLIEVGRGIYGVPCASTQGIAEVPASAIRTLQARESADLGGRTVPLVWTHTILGLGEKPEVSGSRFPALLMGSADRPVAFVVDRVVGDENVIVKPLGPFVRCVPNVSGGIILGDGRVALVLSAGALVDAARGSIAVQPIVQKRPVKLTRRGKLVLIVDDAAITRELERSILASAGYDVETAVDGQDALEKLRSREYALVVADVEMPRLDGFGLAIAIRGDPSLEKLPMVIVSSRESDEDRRRGMELGVQAYVGKGAFDQMTLLDTIESLIG
jgi:chemotaxis protein histidine kinase CheA